MTRYYTDFMLGRMPIGGADDEETTVQDTADEPGREETATEAPEPEDDGGAVGETGADDVQEIEKGGMEDHGAADEAGTGQEEDDTNGEESGQADCEEPAERTDEQTGAQSQREEIAPAQKSTETLEKNMQSWLNTWLMKLKTGTLTETIQTAAIA